MPLINRGVTFTDGDPINGVVNGTRLNALVDSATVDPSFVSSLATTTPALADRPMLFDASGNALIAPTLTDVFATQVVDAAAGVGSLRTLGTTSVKAAQGDLVAYLATSQTFTAPQTKFKHIGGVASGAGVTIAADTGLVAPTTLTVTGFDNYGVITIKPSAATSTTANLCIVTYGVAFGSTPLLLILPKDQITWAAQASTKSVQTGTETAASFKLTSGSVGLVSGTTYNYIFFAIPTS